MIKRVYIEITNVCNLSCPFCLKHSRSPQFMEPEFFEQAALQAKQLTDYLYLHVQGEPLLHPQLEDILSICDRLGCKVQLVTNGSLLSEHLSIVSHACLRKCSISLQSLPYQTLSAEAYLDAVYQWIDACRDTDKITELRFWRREGLEHEKLQYCWNRLTMDFAVQQADRKNNLKLCERVYLTYANEFSWPDGHECSASLPVSGTCLGARQQLAILADGTVVPCCLDGDGRLPLGSLKKQTLMEILNGPACQSLIQQFQNHRITAPLCASCTYRRRFGE